ncbi:MAG: hypothetical protein WCI73_11685, partial [Phycisphaerae bacterium]
FASIYTYLKYAGIGTPASAPLVAPGGSPGLNGSRRSRRWYLIALTLFLLALFSKTVACVLPAVVLVLIWYYRGKLTRRDLLPTLPFFALGLGLATVTTLMEHGKVGTSGPDWAFSLEQRTIIAGRAVWFYVGKLLYPYPLLSVYPRWWGEEPPAKLLIPLSNMLYPLGVLTVLVVLWLLRKRLGRGPLAAVLAFLIMLAPALGFISYYTMLYSFVADHYQYLAAAAMLVLFTESVAWLLRQLPVGLSAKDVRTGEPARPGTSAALSDKTSKRGPEATPRRPSLVLFLAPRLLLGALIFSLAWQSFWQGRLYYRTLDLWKYSFDYNPDSFVVRNNYACQLYLAGRRQEAIAQYLYVARVLRPDDYRAYDNLGRIYRASALDQIQVIDQYLRGLELFFPQTYQAFVDTYQSYWQTPDQEIAGYYYAQAEIHKPASLVALQHRAAGIVERGPLPSAARNLLAQGDAFLAQAENHQAGETTRLARAQQAEEAYRQATRIAGDWPDPWIRLSMALNRQGKEAESRKAFEQAMQLDPGGRDIIRNMGLGAQ